MSLKASIDAAYKSLREVVFDTKLLLLHPDNRYANILVAHLTQDESLHVFYHALQDIDKELKPFIENLISELSQQAQDPQFGKELRKLLANAYENLPESLTELAEHLAQNLDKLSHKPYLLILDDFDLSKKSDEIPAFLEYLLDVLPSQTHLVLKSRQLPRLAWLELLAKQQASIFLGDQIISENFYGNQAQGEFDLEAFAFDSGRVLHQGKAVESWDGVLPRLLFFFVLNRGQVTRAEICQTFWPDLSLEQAVNVFHVTKRRLHMALGIDILVHSEDHYRIDPSIKVYYDVLDFVETITKARNGALKSPKLWQQAIALYRSSFLAGSNMAWVQASRNAFETAFTEATKAIS